MALGGFGCTGAVWSPDPYITFSYAQRFHDIRQDPAYIRTGIRAKKAKPIVFRIRTGYRLTCVCGSGSGIRIHEGKNDKQEN
jgi:hypothetical protein